MQFRHLASLGIALAASGLAVAQTVVLPLGAANTEGSSNNVYPWGRNAGAIRIQTIYDSSHFTGQGISFPIRVLGARYRANGSTATWAGTTYNGVEFSCSTAAVDQAAASSTWTVNRGADHTLVYNGAVQFLGGTGNGTAVPGPTVVDLTFTTPFLYDPSSGSDFLTEVAFAANSWTGGGTTACDVFTTGSNCSRVFNTTNPAATTGTVGLNHALVVELVYLPASGLYANFTATPSSGPTPLTSTFSDTSFSSAPNGVQTWAWDLDGDGIVDSNAQSPSFTYTTCGGYDVTLTVTDGVHPASTRTVRDFILADPQLLVQPSFTWAPGPLPNSIQFTDTSTGNPTVWSWDLDGDNVPDSAQQNPLWSYGTGGAYTVTLTASNACGGATTSGGIFVISNDDCTGALPLPLGLSGPYSNQGATTSQGWPCAAGGTDIWFSYQSTCTGTLEVNTCTGSNYDTALEAFSGSCGSLTSIICNDDNCGLQSRISFAVQPATTYYVRVGGYNGAQGNFQLNTTLTSSGNGSFATQFPACGGANLATTGQPNLGATIGFDITPTTGAPFFMIGSVPLGVPLCPQGCIIGHNMDVVLPAASFTSTIPCWAFLRGGQVYFQGLILGASGGCPSGNPVQLVTTQTILATIG